MPALVSVSAGCVAIREDARDEVAVVEEVVDEQPEVAVEDVGCKRPAPATGSKVPKKKQKKKDPS